MLLNYIPKFLADIKELQLIFSSLDLEIDTINKYVKELFLGQFIIYCDIKYIERFEKILGINNVSHLSTEERRKKLILKFNEVLPYNIYRFKQSLDTICQKDNYYFEIFHSEYRLVLRIYSKYKDDVCMLIDRMLPANIFVEMISQNTHEIVRNFTHEYLSNFKHQQICNEIL